MFKKLRNKLLILNLSIIFILMMVSFSSIYVMTYNDVDRYIQMELHRIADFEKNYKNDDQQKKMPDNDKGKPLISEKIPDRTVSYVLLTSSDWTFNNAISFFSADTEFFENAIASVKTIHQETGRFELDGNYWSFIVTEYNDGYRIVLLDITTQHHLLTNMIVTFLIVALITLGFIFIISLYLTNKSIQPVKAAFEKQKQFIADASHELKTPLAIIQTNVDVLLSNHDQTIESQKKWLGYIKSETERMTKLTSDLLYLTQVDHSEVQMLMSEFNFSQMVEKVILTMEAIIFEKSIDLNYEIQSDIQIKGNQEQLTQVVMILLDNAVKYTPEKGNIRLNLYKAYNHVFLSVTNTGQGIKKDEIHKVFDRFYRSDASRTRKNNSYGLGLSIAKSIIEQHQGKIFAESIEDEETTFTIKLSSSK